LKRLIIVATALALTGCVTAEQNRQSIEHPRAPSQSEISGILSAARDFLYDPYSVRDAEISTVADTKGLDGVTTSMVCVKFNSKNALGGYTGRQLYLLYLDRTGRVKGYNQDWTVPSFCNRMTFRRFTEASRLHDL
jgi:hypothetical protein